MSLILGTSVTGSGGPFQYQIERSLRFNSADSAYLSRTPASAGNRKTWTWSGWVKRSGVTGTHGLFVAQQSTVYEFAGIRFIGTQALQFFLYNGSTYLAELTTSAVYRDTSAWYHVVAVFDTTQATASNRLKLYINGSQVTTFSTATYPSQNTDGYVNSTNGHVVGAILYSGVTDYLNGYMAEVNFIDGQALDPTSFGEYNEDTGVWQPKAYTGSYGTNGFHLDFSDNSGTTSTTLGKDQAGSNNWTPNNFSVTAGVGNDSMVDVPTNYGTDTGAGGEVRGNYITLNPLFNRFSNFSAPYNGNLWAQSSADGGNTFATVPGDGNFYMECYVYQNGNNQLQIGGYNGIWNYTTSQFIRDRGDLYASTGFAQGDTINIATNVYGEMYIGKNGTWLNSSNPVTRANPALTGASGGFLVGSDRYDNTSQSIVVWNFGQRPYTNTCPTGYTAACTTNLPDPAIADGSTAFNPVLYTATGSTLNITGVGFSPDLVWIKQRDQGYSGGTYDIVRGANKCLITSSTAAELSQTDELMSFNADGFTLGASASGYTNYGPTTPKTVAWCWDAGSSTVSNTSGSITSTVRANPTAGFSIVTYTGTGSPATIGHGLGVAPSMLIVKNRTDGTTLWSVYHASVGAGSVAHLNTTAGFSASGDWNSTAPTSTVYSTNGSDRTNKSGSLMVCYAFAPVEGYSAFGSYVGNGSADGPFVYTGFRPRWIMVKRTDTSIHNWIILDTARETYNVVGDTLYANTSDAETANNNPFDFLSNGFKLRNTGGNANVSGGTYIYAAFAENPFKYSLAR